MRTERKNKERPDLKALPRASKQVSIASKLCETNCAALFAPLAPHSTLSIELRAVLMISRSKKRVTMRIKIVYG